jgi:hypothetical protein
MAKAPHVAGSEAHGVRCIRTPRAGLGIGVLLATLVLGAVGATHSSMASAASGSSIVSLDGVADEAGISNDPAAAAGNLDGYGGSLSAQALAAAGYGQGGNVQVSGVTFQWPGEAPGTFVDVNARGQTIALAAPVSGTALAFLGVATGHQTQATGSVTYSDGTTQSYNLGLSDWTFNGGASQLAYGNQIAAIMPYHNQSTGQRSIQTTYVFFAQVALQSGADVSSIALPVFSGAPMHIFAVSVAGIQIANTSTPTSTAVPSTDTPVPATSVPLDSPVPGTSTATDSPVLATGTPTNTQAPADVPDPTTSAPAGTPVPPMSTSTDSPLPPTGTSTGTQDPSAGTPTDSPAPATNTSTGTPMPATSTSTDTPISPTDTPMPPTGTPTDTPVAATSTSTEAPVPATSTPSPTETGIVRSLGLASLGSGTLGQIDEQVYPNGGSSIAAVGSYTNWSDANGNDWPTVKPRLDAIHAAGAVPVLSWGSDGATNCDRCIADGQVDTYINAWAQDFKSLPYTVVVRFDWEMNGFWFGFSAGANGNTSADYVAMWRHVHDVFTANGVTNVRWFWCPNTSDGIGDFSPDYPGDAYVDYVGVDLFNWGTFHSANSWQTFTQLMTQSYGLLSTLTSSKPIILGEIGSCDTIYNGGTGDTKEAWITSAFLTEIPQSFPRIVAFMWFNESKSGECNFQIDSTPATLAAFQQVAASPLWQGAFPSS